MGVLSDCASKNEFASGSREVSLVWKDRVINMVVPQLEGLGFVVVLHDKATSDYLTQSYYVCLEFNRPSENGICRGFLELSYYSHSAPRLNFQTDERHESTTVHNTGEMIAYLVEWGIYA